MESVRRELYSQNTLTELQVATLRKLGVDGEALLAAGALFTAAVVFGKDGLFTYATETDTGARNALLMPAYDGDMAVDIVAVDPARPGTFATRDGSADVLGEDNYSCAMGGGLRVYRNPLSWLRDGADGIVILRRKSAWRVLRDVPRIIAEDKAHGRELERLAQPPRWRGEVFHFEEIQESEAA